MITAALAAERIAAWRPEQAGDRLRAADRVLSVLHASGAPAELRIEALIARANDSIVLGDRRAAERAIAEVRQLAEGRWTRSLWETELFEVGLAAADARFGEARELAVAAARRWGPHHPDARRALVEQLGLIAAFDGDGHHLPDPELAHEVIAHTDIGAYRAAVPLVLAQSGQLDDAARELSQIAADDYSVVPEHTNWAFSMAMLVEAAIRLDAPDCCPNPERGVVLVRRCLGMHRPVARVVVERPRRARPS